MNSLRDQNKDAKQMKERKKIQTRDDLDYEALVLQLLNNHCQNFTRN